MRYDEQAEVSVANLVRAYKDMLRCYVILYSAMEEIESMNPETPNDFSNVREIARRAINECD